MRARAKEQSTGSASGGRVQSVVAARYEKGRWSGWKHRKADVK